METVNNASIKKARHGNTAAFNEEAVVSSVTKGVYDIGRIKLVGLPRWTVNDVLRAVLRGGAAVDHNGCGRLVCEDLMVVRQSFVGVDYYTCGLWSVDVANRKLRVVCGDGSGAYDYRVDERSKSMQTFDISWSGDIVRLSLDRSNATIDALPYLGNDEMRPDSNW
jgi:hypothetical protein